MNAVYHDANVTRPDRPIALRWLRPHIRPRLDRRPQRPSFRRIVAFILALTLAVISDGPLFRPRILPTPSAADDVTTVTRGFVAAFLDHVLRDAPVSVFGDVDAPTHVQVSIYPLVAK